MSAELLGFLPILAASGVLAGVLSGLLGIGGGIIMIPVLYFALGLHGVVEEFRMHVALATSLAIIIPTSLSSVRAHRKRDSVDTELARQWGVFLVLGAAIGAALASQVTSGVLIAVFASLAAMMGVKMILPLENLKVADRVPQGVLGRVAPTVIGLLAALMGIGGATFSVPYMTLFGVPIHRAVGTASLLGLLISVTGGLGYLIGGIAVEGLPAFSIGFISLPAVIVIAPLTVLSAPWGARLAHGLSRRTLSVIFGLFLIGSSARLVIEKFVQG